LTQLVHFRAQIIHDIQRVIGGRAKTGNITGITWCVLTQATERYFERKGEENYWRYDQVREHTAHGLNLLRSGFPAKCREQASRHQHSQRMAR